MRDQTRDWIIERYKHLIDKTYNNIYLSSDLLIAIVKKLIKMRRRKFALKSTVNDEAVVEGYIEESEIIKNIPSVYNLVNNNPSFRNEPKNPKLKPENVRNIVLDLYDLSDYTESERKFIKGRLDKYINSNSDLKPNDEFLIHEIVLLELEIFKLNKLKVQDPEDSKGYSNKIKILMDLYQKLSEGLGVLKKSRAKLGTDIEDGKENIYSQLDDLDKITSEDLENEEEEIMKEARRTARKRGK